MITKEITEKLHLVKIDVEIQGIWIILDLAKNTTTERTNETIALKIDMVRFHENEYEEIDFMKFFLYFSGPKTSSPMM